MPGEVPAGRGTQRRGGRAVLHPQRPATGARRGEDAEGDFPQRKVAGLTARRSRQGGRVRGGVAEAQEGSARLRASRGGEYERIRCEVCTAAVNQGHRVVRLL